MKAIQIISQDLFDKVRSRFQNLEMGDETGAVTIDPAEARFFDFDFVLENINLGRVSISINDLGSLKLYYSQGITENQDDPAKKIWYSFLKEMRFFAMRRLLRFDTRDIAKTNLDKNDFQYLATTGPKDEKIMNMNESRWNNKSTKKTSRAVTGTTEVIVRHSAPVGEMYPGARSHPKKINKIFVQSKLGERFMYPFIHLEGAFALAQHVEHGGTPYDSAGKAIIDMSNQIAQLQEFKKGIQTSSLNQDALGIAETAVGRLMELKSKIKALGKRKHYEQWISEFNEVEHPDQELTELDPVQFEEYKQKFTQSSFNEELGKIFPLIHNIMQEKNTIDIDDYVSEEDDKTEENDDHKPQNEDAFSVFEEWADATEQGKLTDDQVEKLKQSIEELEASGQQLEFGVNGQTAFEFFGIDNQDLKNQLEQGAEDSKENQDITPMDIFKSWAQQEYPELLSQLGMGSEEPAQEPAQEPVADQGPAPEEEPAAEMTQPEGPGTGSTVHGIMPAENGSKIPKGMMKEIAETVKSFYNADNESIAPFRSEEGICIEVEKKIGEKYGESVGKHAGMLAKQFMEKLTKQWEMKHNKNKEELSPVEDDGLSRLKELLGNVKAKVENMSNQSPADEEFDPSKIDPKKAEIPAFKRKQEYPAKQAADQAMANRNKQAGADVWKSARRESAEMESILKLAGLTK